MYEQFDEWERREFRGRKAVLALSNLLQQFAEKSGQLGAMNFLGYFLGGRGAYWKQPVLLLFLRRGSPQTPEIGNICAAALFYEIAAVGLRSGAYATDDWEGLRTVIVPVEYRGVAAAYAAETLMQRGAYVVLTTYRGGEAGATPLVQKSGLHCMKHCREVKKQRLQLAPTYEQTLQKFGKATRFNFRYYRKRLHAETGSEFIADALSFVSESEILRMNSASLNPVTEDECLRRYRAVRNEAGGFLVGLRDKQGRVLSVLGGWRQGNTTVMHHQINLTGYDRFSLGTVMRAYFLECEIARGAKNVIFYHGTNHTMSHVFEREETRDLALRRDSFRVKLFTWIAERLASSSHYSDAHYFGGSTTFFAAVLASKRLKWEAV